MPNKQIQISVDFDIYEHLRAKSTFEDTVSTVLRRELGLEASADSSAAVPISDRKTAPRPTDPGKTTRRSRKPKRTRAPAGTLLPEAEYHRPILEAIVAHGGSASKQAVIDDVGDRLDSRLTPADRDVLESGSVRWHSRAQFARLKLAQRGFIDNEAPRGMWAITDDGRRALEEDSI